jgi:hypothetical protein
LELEGSVPVQGTERQSALPFLIWFQPFTIPNAFQSLILAFPRKRGANMTEDEAYRRISEIWNTLPISVGHRQELVSELAELQAKWHVGGVSEYEAMLDAAKEKGLW